MYRLAWIVFQIGVIALVMWLDYDTAQAAHSEPHPGLALGMGIAAAFFLTYGLMRLRDWTIGLHGYWFRGGPKPKLWITPAGFKRRWF